MQWNMRSLVREGGVPRRCINAVGVGKAWGWESTGGGFVLFQPAMRRLKLRPPTLLDDPLDSTLPVNLASHAQVQEWQQVEPERI